MEKNQKIPLHLLEGLSLKDKLDQSIMDIFHFNQIKLVQLQEEINCCTDFKAKEVVLKVYTIFEDLSHIFGRLGIEDLYHQIRLIVNTISKVVLNKQISGEEKQPAIMKKLTTVQQEISSVIVKSQQKPEIQSKKSCKSNRLRGIFLYNESYSKHVERNLDLQKQKTKKYDLRQLEDPLDNIEQIQRQEMLYYIERKKQLSVLKVKDHSKSYQQMQNQFRVVQERLKQVLQNLQYQLDHQNIKQFQYVSKQQISKQLLSFNTTMRSQLVILKQQYNNANDSLKEQNIELRDKLSEIASRKSSMVNTQTQTVETISSIKKVKKLAEEYELKIKILEKRIEEGKKKEEEMVDRQICKEKEIAILQKNLTKKQQDLQQYKDKCFALEEVIKQMNSKVNKVIKEAEQPKNNKSNEPSMDRIETEQDQYLGINKMRVKKSFINRSSMNKNMVNPISRFSDSSFSKTDGYKFPSFIENQTTQAFRKQQSYGDGNLYKKMFASRWSKNGPNSTNDEKIDNLVDRSVMRQKSLAYNIGEVSQTASKAQIQALKTDIRSGSCSLIDLKNPVDGDIRAKIQTQFPKKRQRSPAQSQQQQIKRRRISKKGKTKSVVIHQQIDKFEPIKKQNIINVSNTILKNSPVANNSKIAGNTALNDSKGNGFRHAQVKRVNQDNMRKSGFSNSGVRNTAPNRGMVPNTGRPTDTTNIARNTTTTIPTIIPTNTTTNTTTNSQVDYNMGVKIGLRDTAECGIKQTDRQIAKEQVRTGDNIFGSGQSLNTQQNKPTILDTHPFQPQPNPGPSPPPYLSQPQLLQITELLLKSGNLSDPILTQLSGQYPQFLPAMKTYEYSHKLYQELNRIHQKNCVEKPCRHLQIFVQFCAKFKDGINSGCKRRKAMRLHVQDFCKV